MATNQAQIRIVKTRYAHSVGPCGGQRGKDKRWHFDVWSVSETGMKQLASFHTREAAKAYVAQGVQ